MALKKADPAVTVDPNAVAQTAEETNTTPAAETPVETSVSEQEAPSETTVETNPETKPDPTEVTEPDETSETPVVEIPETPSAPPVEVNPTPAPETNIPKVEPQVRIRMACDHRCTIGMKLYDLKKGQCYNVPPNVKRVLNNAGLLAPL